jgi:hypothetical protein
MASDRSESMRRAVDDQREIVIAWLQTTGATVSVVLLVLFVLFFLYIGFFR